MNKETYEQQALQGHSHYCILVSQSQYINCYKNAMSGKCWASFSNSSVRLVGNPKQNARRQGKKMLSICTINANDEILVSYGLAYKFPLETDRTILRLD